MSIHKCCNCVALTDRRTYGFLQVLPEPGKRLVVRDNHKPVFTNCSQYAPSVNEEEPLETYVFTVQAFDRDPPDAGGTINYTFVSAPGERLRFTIDPETGVIKTRHVSASHFLECCTTSGVLAGREWE